MTMTELKKIIKNEKGGLPTCCIECNMATDCGKCELDTHDISTALKSGMLDYHCPAWEAKIENEQDDEEFEKFESEVLK